MWNCDAKDNPHNKFWRVASYARLSREDDASGISESIIGQQQIIESYVSQRGNAEIVAQYVDDGYSGATFDRPGFMRMIEDARNGLFDTIVVKDLSRFGRSYLDCGSFIERELPSMGVRLFSITDNFDSMRKWDYNMALLVPMKNLMNEMQVIMTSEKVRASLAAKRARGECVANFAPYGYVKDPDDRHRLVVDEVAAVTVRRIFWMRLNGASASGIARTLNNEGIPSPYAHRMGAEDPAVSSRWHAKTVLRILRDETYTGTLVQGKTERLSWRMRTSVRVPSEQWVRTPNAHVAIIDADTFGHVAAMVERRQNVQPSWVGNTYDEFAPEALKCPGCGGSMAYVRVRRSGKTYAYFTCAAHRRNPRVCSPHSIRVEELLSQYETRG